MIFDFLLLTKEKVFPFILKISIYFIICFQHLSSKTGWKINQFLAAISVVTKPIACSVACVMQGKRIYLMVLLQKLFLHLRHLAFKSRFPYLSHMLMKVNKLVGIENYDQHLGWRDGRQCSMACYLWLLLTMFPPFRFVYCDVHHEVSRLRHAADISKR